MIDCEGCGACCRYTSEMAVHPDDAFLDNHRDLTYWVADPNSRAGKGYHMLKQAPDDGATGWVCSAQSDDGWSCTVNDTKPRKCQTFEVGGAQCLEFREWQGVGS